MERKNGLLNHPAVETTPANGARKNVVTPTHAYVRLGPAQRMRVELPMSQRTQKLILELTQGKN